MYEAALSEREEIVSTLMYVMKYNKVQYLMYLIILESILIFVLFLRLRLLKWAVPLSQIFKKLILYN